MQSKIFLSMLPIVLATPFADDLQDRAAIPLCPAVKNVVTKLKQQDAATAFCSSYLRIPVHTACLLELPMVLVH